MKFLPYLLKHLRRNWFRTTLTVLAMSVCIFLFCTLQTVLARDQPAARQHQRQAPGHAPLGEPGVRRAARLRRPHPVRPGGREGGDQQLVRRLAAGEEGRQGSGEDAEATTDWSNFFPNMAVELEPYFAMYPEFEMPPDQ